MAADDGRPGDRRDRHGDDRPVDLGHRNFFLDVLPAMVVFGLGMSCLVAPLTATVMGSVPADDVGIASGVEQRGVADGRPARGCRAAGAGRPDRRAVPQRRRHDAQLPDRDRHLHRDAAARGGGGAADHRPGQPRARPAPRPCPVS